MKTIIAGGRTITDPEVLLEALEACPWSHRITEVVCGKAEGADTLGEDWANASGIPVKPFPADWKKHGKAAGPIRNGEMAVYADSLIALWDTRSTGTRDMIAKATLKKLKVFVYKVSTE